tara:strand:+ start:209 stop:466 length:258 start_codon:yes stop_codon:yes gene_type:complete
MSASATHTERVLRIVLLCGLFGCGGVALADEEEIPDLEFLEYLGSWDESDEDWVLLAENDAEEALDDESKLVPQGDKVAELDHEN